MVKWELFTRIARYAAVGDHARKLRAAGLPVEFDAMSVGKQTGQIAIIPLDESNEKNGRLIAGVPVMYAALAQIALYQGSDYPADKCAEIAMDALAKVEA